MPSTKAIEHVVDVVVGRLHECDGEILGAFSSQAEHHGISIESDHSSFGTDPLGDRRGMSTGSRGGVDVKAARLRVEPGEHFVEKDGQMDG